MFRASHIRSLAINIRDALFCKRAEKKEEEEEEEEEKMSRRWEERLVAKRNFLTFHGFYFTFVNSFVSRPSNEVAKRARWQKKICMLIFKRSLNRYLYFSSV